MSYLNSIIGSLEGKATVSVPEVRPAKSPAGNGSASLSTKRKAEDDLSRSNIKATKVVPTKSLTNSSRPTLTPTSKSNVPERPKSAAPRNDLSKRPEQPSSNQRPSSALPPQSKPAPQNPSNPALVAVKAPPKKGSYADIMARAAQNKEIATATPIGTIKHKPKEKMSLKKELAMQKEALKNGKKGGLGRGAPMASGGKPGAPSASKVLGNGKPGQNDIKKSAYQGTMNPSKPQPGYQGTAQPKPKAQVAYSGTAQSKSQPQKKKGYDSEPERVSKKPSAGTLRRHYRSEENSEEDEEEDPYDYASEDYSDMDAGFDDVWEEDEKAEKIAKKEDKFEAMMLEELKRQKEKRKREEARGRG